MVLRYEESFFTERFEPTVNREIDIDYGDTNNGCECLFIKIDDKTGLKLYRSKEEALDAHHFQYVASIYTLAPDVVSIPVKIKMNMDDWRHVLPSFMQSHVYLYGFYTEVITILPAITDARFPVLLKYLQRINRQLKREAQQYLAWDIYDDHIDNLGFKGNRMVFIDFGHCSNYANEFPDMKTYRTFGK